MDMRESGSRYAAPPVSGGPTVYGAPPGRVPLAQRRWLLPAAAGVLVAGLLAGGVMAALAIPSGRHPRTSATTSRLPGDIADTPPLPAQPPAADPSPVPTTGAPSQVIPPVGTLHTASSKCLTFGKDDDGARAKQDDCDGSPRQRWQLNPLSAGTYQIVNASTGKCLDVNDASKDDGAKIQQWGCHNAANQQWKVNWQADSFTLVSVNSGRCLAIEKDGQTRQRDCAGNDSQRWTVGPG